MHSSVIKTENHDISLSYNHELNHNHNILDDNLLASPYKDKNKKFNLIDNEI